MKKIINKIIYILLIGFVIFGNLSSVLGAELNTRLDVIQQASETKYLENDQGYISKTIVDSNAETGEVTIELKLSNTKQETTTVNDTEIFFVIDNSPSMDFVTESGATRKEIVIPAAKNLAEKLFDNSSSLKIGVVKFSGGYSVSAASTLMCSLTNDKDRVLNTLDTLNSQSTSGGTNILAGVTRANNNFSSDCPNRIIVLLTDGVPNYDLTSYENSANDSTSDIAKTIQQNTKNGLINISDSGTYIISMMTGISENDGNTDKEGNVYDDGSSIEDDLLAVENIFGTSANPTVGKFYLVASADIESIVNNDILNDVIEKIQNPINTVKVVDYFPEDITENFEFSYVGNPNVGTVSEGIDEETKTITWDIGTLKGDEVATLQYKLKMKDMGNTELLNRTISTNEKVVLTYTDVESEEYTVTLTSSPKIQLSEVEEVVAQPEEPKVDNTEKPEDTTIITGKLPDTGLKIGVVLLLVVSAIGIIAYLKSNKLKGI